MKISAIDIRKHTFEKIFRGYDPDEVDAFLNSISQEWERVTSEVNLIKMQLDYAEKELAKLKDIESTLFRTLKTAEDASKQIEKEAIENADKRIQESKLKSDQLVLEAENRTNQVIRETEERLKKLKEDFGSEIKKQERDFKAIENFRDNLVVQLTALANNTIETVERFEQKYDKASVLNQMEEIKQHVSEIEIPKKPVYIPNVVEPTPAPETEPEKEAKNEVIFEIVDSEEPVAEIEEVVAEEEITVEEVVEVELPAEVEEEPEAIIEETVEEVVVESIVAEESKKKSAADEANEALEEMHRNAEKARDATNEYNRIRNTPPEKAAPKKTGGGSFFDQI